MALSDAAPFVKWRCSMDEASGDRVDSIAAHNAVQNGTVTSAAGKLSNAAVFPYTTADFLEVTSHADILSGDTDFLVAVWCYITANLGDYPILAHKGFDTGSATDREWMLFIDGGTGKTGFTVRDSGGTQTTVNATSATGLTVGSWHLACGWHKAGANLLGASLDAVGDETAYTTGVQSGTGALRLGYSSGQVLKFNGMLDEALFMRGYVLSTAEQVSLYNAGAGVAFPSWAGAAAAPLARPLVASRATRRASNY